MVYVGPYMFAAEKVAEPAQILTGRTGSALIAPLKDWADGTYSEYVLTLPTVLTRRLASITYQASGSPISPNSPFHLAACYEAIFVRVRRSS
jgi:hypothetical protein